jgi:hypothetical protein
LTIIGLTNNIETWRNTSTHPHQKKMTTRTLTNAQLKDLSTPSFTHTCLLVHPIRQHETIAISIVTKDNEFWTIVNEIKKEMEVRKQMFYILFSVDGVCLTSPLDPS